MKRIFLAFFLCLTLFSMAVYSVTLLSPLAEIPRLLNGNLVRLADGELKPVDDASVGPVRYYAIYYSADWCPVCHKVTPKLAEFYKSFKPSHPNFELIFVSQDNDSAGMLAYMKEMSMPWPAVSFSHLNHDGSGIERFLGNELPDLVLVDVNGKVLSDTYHGAEYVGPDAVMEDIKKMVK